MAKILMFGNKKGGVGKSTLTMLAANALSNAPFNFTVTVADIDAQKSIVNTRKFDADDLDGAFSYDVLDLDFEALQTRLNDLNKTQDFILIDAPGKLDAHHPTHQQEITKAMVYLDYLFVPFVAGGLNLDATLNYLRFAIRLKKQRSKSARPLQIIGFVNRYRTRTRINRYLLDDMDDLRKAAPGVAFMINSLKDYTAFADADTYTNLYKPDANDAPRQNFTKWFDEFLKLMQ